MALAITSPSTANITDTSTSVSISWSGATTGTNWKIEGVIIVNGVVVNTTTIDATSTGTVSVPIASVQTAIYNAATNASSLSGIITLRINNYLDVSPFTNYTVNITGGNLTIARRLTSPSNTTVVPYLMNTFSTGDTATYNWRASWDRPHTAFRGRVKVYVAGTLIATYQGFTTNISRTPTEAEADAMVAAMGANTSANLYYVVDTGFALSNSTTYYTSGAITTGNVSITRNNPTITSPANVNISDTTASISVSWGNGFTYGSWRVSGSLRINGTQISSFDVASGATGTQTLSISANQAALYNAATGSSLTGAVSVVLSNYLASPSISHSTTLGSGNLTIANRLSAPVNGTLNPYNLDNFNGTSTYNFIASWTRPHTAFRGRVKIYAHTTLIGTYSDNNTSMSRLPSTAEIDAMVAAMGSVSPRNLYYVIETGFVANTTQYFTGGELTTGNVSLVKSFIQPSPISISNFTLTDSTTAVPYTLTVGSSGATHITRLYIRVGSTDHLVKTETGITGSGTKNFTIGATERNIILNAMPSSTSATTWAQSEATLSGNTAFADSKLVATTVSLDAAYKPVNGTITRAENNTYLAAITGSNYFLTGKSNVLFTMPSTMATGATRASTRVQFAGTDATITGTGTTLTTSALATAGANSTATITVTDSRGRSTVSTITGLVVRAYTNPTINSFTVERRNSADTASDPLGTRMRAVINIAATTLLNHSGVEQNHVRWVVEYRLRPSGTWTAYSSNTSNTTLTVNTTSSLTSPTFPVNSSYDIRIRAYDRFYDLNNNGALNDTDAFAESIIVLPFGRVGFMLGEGSDGITRASVGKVWSQGTLDVEGDIYSAGSKVLTEATNSALAAYPVGAIYMSVNSTSPATLFGGTWVEIANQFLVGAGATYPAGSTGGAATHTHTTPSHTHTVADHTHSIPSHTHTGPSHTHTIADHTHTVPAHSHTLSQNGYAQVNVTGIGGSFVYLRGRTRPAWTPTDRVTASSYVANTTAQSWGADLAGTTDDSTAVASGGSGTLTTAASGTGATGAWSGTSGSGGAQTTSSNNGGDTGSSSNLPPYLSVYMWRRTA